MNPKLTHAGVALLSVGAIGIIFAVVMEMLMAEPIYFVVMKVTALFFGVGGGLIGIAAISKK